MLVYCGDGRGLKEEERDPFMGKLREEASEEEGRAAASWLDDAAMLAIPRMQSQKFCCVVVVLPSAPVVGELFFYRRPIYGLVVLAFNVALSLLTYKVVYRKVVTPSVVITSLSGLIGIPWDLKEKLDTSIVGLFSGPPSILSFSYLRGG